jgi:polysaccharide export outer membrane protein
MTLYGMRDSVIVMREQNGERHTYVVNMLSGKDILESPAYYIQQGDVIYVKPNNYRRRQSTANASEVTTASFWLSALSVLATLSVLIFK